VTTIVPPPSAVGSLSGVVALSQKDVWAVGSYNGSTLVLHWDGLQWSVVPSPSPGSSDNLYGITAVSTSGIWAVGEYNDGTAPYQTLTMHWNGTQWSTVSSPNVTSQDNHLFGVSAVASNDVWAVGSVYNYGGSSSPQTLTMHWNGTAWSVVPSPNPGSWRNYLYGVAALSANDVWAVGGFGAGDVGHTLVEHWDGAQWNVTPSQDLGSDDNYLLAVAALSPSDLWTAGYYWSSSATYELTLVERYSELCTSPTPTPTNTPIIVGHAAWQGPPAQPNALQQLPITLTLKLGTTEVDYPAQTTDANGFFTVSVGSLLNGTYNWRAKGPKYLANSGLITITGAQSTSVDIGLMRVGDCNNDNNITVTDFIIEKSSFGKGQGDPGYDPRADFDGNNRVNVTDFNLLRGNFGQGGAPPIGPDNP
jgi:hypothetical protein